ncbi:uncharacterized protein LOC108863935 [Galendromus occidentalis]|uniref:Uncharacterized protein LOC108863935 n=1 Tax=Galendromus occidentalis TaxID=34638 RepID=A0AAJ7L4Z4_9ACAR|nr:uncharacterized protein LOC108863935 [Galendromus occidentalis]
MQTPTDETAFAGSADPTSGIHNEEYQQRSSVSDPQNRYVVKDPAKKIPRFNGDPIKFDEWWSLFSYFVDSKPIEVVEKCRILKGSLSGSALKTVAHLRIAAESYEIMKFTISEAFGDPDVAKAALLQNIHSVCGTKDLSKPAVKCQAICRTSNSPRQSLLRRAQTESDPQSSTVVDEARIVGKKCRQDSAMEYSFDERTDMFEVYVACGKNAELAVGAYRLRFPDRQVPSRTLFSRLEKNLRNFGRLYGVPKSFPSEELETDVLAFVGIHPQASSREMASICATDHSTVLDIMRKHNLKPFKISKTHHLQIADLERRRNFCTWFIGQHERDPRICEKILWSDECNFNSRGFFNRKNTHYWSETKLPNFRETNSQYRFSLNVWCGIIGSRIIGPHIYEGTLNGEGYRNFIQNELMDLLDDLPLALRREMIFVCTSSIQIENTTKDTGHASSMT